MEEEISNFQAALNIDDENSEDILKLSCKVCNRVFDAKSGISHHPDCQLNNSKKKYKCAICDLRFYTKSGLSTHILSHEKLALGKIDDFGNKEAEEIKKFKCDFCEERFHTESNVMLHITLKHKKLEYMNVSVDRNGGTSGQNKTNSDLHNFRISKHVNQDVTQTSKSSLNKNTSVEVNLNSEDEFNFNNTLFQASSLLDPPQNAIQNHTKSNENYTYICSSKDNIITAQENVSTNDILSNTNNIKNNSITYVKTKKNKPIITNNMKKSGKISEIFGQVITETLYSSDSDCEYEIVQTVVKIKQKDSKYECNICHKKFVKYKHMRYHMKKHKSDTIDKNIANQTNIFDNINCELSTVIKDSNAFLVDINFQNNESRFQEIEEDPNEKELQNTTKQNTNPKKSLYQCAYCKKAFKYSSNLSNHLKLHLNQSIVKRKLHNGAIVASKRFSCSFCSKTFANKLNYENHVSSHKKEEKDEANSNIEDDGSVLLKPYLCMVCGKGFKSSSHLSVHIRNHNNIKPHLCSICGKSFTIKQHLTIHFRTHTKEQPFECQHCGKKFIQKGNLNEHLRTHTGIKPHCCSICGKRFAHNSGLTQHLLTHTTTKKHKCNICGKAFRFGGHYREHIRTHSGFKPYKCNVCERAFSNSSSLVVHKRTHSGERPFKCVTCHHGFIKSYGLKQHYKTHPQHDVQNDQTNNT